MPSAWLPLRMRKGKGVLIAMNDQIKAPAANKDMNIQKARQKPVGLAGHGGGGATTGSAPGEAPHHRVEFNIDTIGSLPQVDIVYSHGNVRPRPCRRWWPAGPRPSFTLARAMARWRVKPLQEAQAKGVVIVRSSRGAVWLCAANAEQPITKLRLGGGPTCAGKSPHPDHAGLARPIPSPYFGTRVALPFFRRPLPGAFPSPLRGLVFLWMAVWSDALNSKPLPLALMDYQVLAGGRLGQNRLKLPDLIIGLAPAHCRHHFTNKAAADARTRQH